MVYCRCGLNMFEIGNPLVIEGYDEESEYDSATRTVYIKRAWYLKCIKCGEKIYTHTEIINPARLQSKT